MPDHIVANQYVQSGSMWARVDEAPAIAVASGEILFVPCNDRHYPYSSEEVEPVDADTLIRPGTEGELAWISWGCAGGERCCII